MRILLRLAVWLYYFGEHNGLINDLDKDGYAEVAISAAYERLTV